MSSNKILSNIYNNIFEYINYRNLKLIDERLNNEEFNKQIQYNKYIIIRTVDNNNLDISDNQIKELKIYLNNYSNKLSSKNKNNITNEKYDFNNIKIINIILLHNDTDYDSKTMEFKKLINLIRYPNGEILIISKKDFSTHVGKQINILSTNNIQIYNYPYRLFKIIIPNHILCSKHRIISEDEENELLNNYLYCEKKNLPIINIDDPQVIWIGAKANQIIEIQRNSETTGKSLYYRLVKEI
jgi:DNA-directed RNA polymerase subunit H (RpoH/RPB5)